MGKAKEIEKFSFSKLTTFKTCPLSYYYTYVEKLDRKDNIYSFLGTFIHSSLEDLQTGKTTIDEVIKNFKDKIDDADMLGFDFPTENSKKNFIECIIKYFENYKPFSNITDFKIEEYFEVVVQNITVRGYIDIYTITDNKYIDIYDYKSSSKFSKKELETKKLQLILYGIALKEKYPDKIIRSLNFDMCKYTINNKGALIERNKSDVQEERGLVSIEFNSIVIKEAEDFILNTYKNINRLNKKDIKEWKANVNPFFCKNLCSNYKLCRVISKGGKYDSD